jgi:hypothetical protein
MGTVSTTGGLIAPGMTTTPGVYGSLVELVIDASRPIRLDELFGAYTGYSNVAQVVALPSATSNAAGAATVPAGGGSPLTKTAATSDLKTVRWFVRQGAAVDPNSADITSIKAEAQLQGAGLVRQQVDRARRLWAEQWNDMATLESGQRLVAPEVVGMQFRYLDGATLQLSESWDTQVLGGLPIAVEVRLWLADAAVVNSPEIASMGPTGVLAHSREFRQVIFLPTAQPPSTTAAAAAGGTTTGATTGTAATTN